MTGSVTTISMCVGVGAGSEGDWQRRRARRRRRSIVEHGAGMHCAARLTDGELAGILQADECTAELHRVSRIHRLGRRSYAFLPD